MLSRCQRLGILTTLLVTVAAASGSAFGIAATEHRGVDQHGNTHEILKGSGTYTVLDFAASWCGPCYKALPKLETLAAQFPEIRVLVISVDDESEGRDRMVKDLALSLPVLWDEGHRIVESFSPEGFPATYVLAPDGEILYHHDGFDEKKHQELRRWLEKLGTGTQRISGR